MTPPIRMVSVPVADLEEVRDLLMERRHGSPARSPAHNARLAIDAMLTAAPVREEGGAVRQAVLAFNVEEYVEGYEFSGDEGFYTPTEDERALITDAIHGVISELSLAAREEAPAGHHERNLSMTNGQLIEQALSHPPLEAPAEAGERETLRVLLDNMVIAQSLSKELRQRATDEARSYLYALRAQPQAREEGGAEAGEDDDGDIPWPDTRLSNALHKHFSELHGLDNEDASEEVHGVLEVIKALRAQPQPQAREKAQPVAWRSVWSDGTPYGEPHSWPPLDGASVYHGLMGRTIQPLYAAPPAPEDEKLRVLDVVGDYLIQQYGKSYGLHHPVDRKRILAALQQEGRDRG